MSAVDIAFEIGKSIVTDHAVVSSTQTLITTTISGGSQIAGAAITGGSVGATASAVGASISSAATGVGHAIMGTKAVTVATTILTSPAAPFVLVGAAILGGLWWLCKD